MNTPKQAVTAHYMAHWGLPKFHIQESDPFELAVVEFSPGRQWGPLRPLDTMRLATNGMHNYLQSYQGEGYRTELYLCARTAAPWIIQFLAALARYPLLYDTYLGEYNTIPRAEPFHPGNASYAAFLLAPPEPEDSGTLGVIWEATPEPIHVHRVVAITEPEYEFALKHRNGQALWERLVGMRLPLLVDEARPDAALGPR